MLNFCSKLGALSALQQESMDKRMEQPEAAGQAIASYPSFTAARIDRYGRRMPQTIAHRGYKVKYPENTMLAMKSAVEVGVQGLETDVHLSSDGVVVLSHDKNLKRCFGIDKNIIDCDWKFLSELRTTREPHEPLPRLEDLIRYLAEPCAANIWLLLDIKNDNDPETIIRRMSETVGGIQPAPSTSWNERIVLGCWSAKFMPHCQKYFPDFPITHISISTCYSRQFLAVPNISFNMFFPVLVTPFGTRFIKAAKTQGRQVYAWTVNDTKKMDWCIRQGIDGVITDDPQKFVDVLEHFDEHSSAPRMTMMELFHYARINIFIWLFALIYTRGFRSGKSLLKR